MNYTIEQALDDYQHFYDHWREMATDRVKSKLLQPYKDILLDYDWDDPDHMEWVATAPFDEILDWCKTVREAWEAAEALMSD